MRQPDEKKKNMNNKFKWEAELEEEGEMEKEVGIWWNRGRRKSGGEQKIIKRRNGGVGIGKVLVNLPIRRQCLHKGPTDLGEQDYNLVN